MKTNYYAGIGSRSVPNDIGELMTEIARFQASRGWILRSGGAIGADNFFEKGAGNLKEIYLPWFRFNNNDSLLSLNEMTEAGAAEEITQGFHPAWDKLSQGAKKMMVRNCFQVLGANLTDYSKYVICWTSDRKDSGGTGQAIRIANAYDIPVYNLFFEETREKIKKQIDNHR